MPRKSMVSAAIKTRFPAKKMRWSLKSILMKTILTRMMNNRVAPEAAAGSNGGEEEASLDVRVLLQDAQYRICKGYGKLTGRHFSPSLVEEEDSEYFYIAEKANDSNCFGEQNWTHDMCVRADIEEDRHESLTHYLLHRIGTLAD